MASEPITARNAKLKHLRRLVNRGDVRAQHNALVAEGPILVSEALASDRLVHEVFAEPGSADLVWAQAKEAGLDVTLVADGALSAVLGTQVPQPVAAVVEVVEYALEDLEMAGHVLVLVDVRDPGNVGTLIRTAEASGAAGLVLAGTSVDPTNPKVVRSSAGAAFRLPVVRVADTTSVFAYFEDIARPTFAAVLDTEAIDYTEADLTTSVIVLGNEAHGLEPDVGARANQLITIRLDGPTESLNVAATGAVLCFEALRQRRADPVDENNRGAGPYRP